jgi:SAM-dependent methyltransferase
MQKLKNDEIRQAVRKSYGKIAKADDVGCGCNCDCGSGNSPEDTSVSLGYSSNDVSTIPKGANMGLGCGNPQAIASLQPGETVLDLGSGGGFDCFLAAKAVGESGHVIGVDMTPEMINKASKNAVKAGFSNVEFRLGEIENLPVADNTVDVIISNCVINLSPEKPEVFSEVYRALKPGGRLAVTDVVATTPLPEKVKNDMELLAGCIAGAAQIDELKSILERVGFTNIRIKPIDASKEIISQWSAGSNIGDFIVSATIEAIKPQH